MGLLLGPIGLACVIAWLVIVVKTLLAILKSASRAVFLKHLLVGSVAGGVGAIALTTLPYIRDKTAYIAAAWLYVVIGPPTWLLLIAFFVLRKLAADRRSERYAAYAYGALMTIPIIGPAWVFHAASLLALFGVRVSMH